ncbi:MAG: hypothetical protein NC452_20305 [Eubacterium sp.]|nr:hypothetical protein [Eubacterium sp.]
MTAAMNLLDFSSFIIEIAAIIIGIHLFGIHNINAITKLRFIFALTAYVGVSILDFILIDMYGDSIGLILSILYIAKLFLPLFLMLGAVNLKICYFIVLMDLIISFFSNSAAYIVSNLFETMPMYISSAVTLFIRVLIFVLLIIIIKRTDTNKVIIILKMIPTSVFVLLLMAILSLSALVSLINYDTNNYIFKENLTIIIVVALSVILAYIIMMLFLNVIAKQHFTAVSQMMEKQVELQINHYNNLEKIDAEMRKFRHDYTNHLTSILSLIRMNECSQA